MSHKRKYRKVAPTTNLVASRSTPDLFTLSIQAHEATIIRGPQCLSTALSLEAPHLPTLGVYANDPQIGNALIQWGASTRNFQLLNSDSSFPEGSDDNATWVDRGNYIFCACNVDPSDLRSIRFGLEDMVASLSSDSTQFDTKFV